MATTANLLDNKIDIGRVISRGFSAIAGLAVPFAAASILLVGLPTFLGQYLLLETIGDLNPATFGSVEAFTASSLPYYWLSWLLTVIAGYLLQAALVRSTILHLSGRAADLRGSIGIALRLLLPMVGLAILSTFLVGLGFILFVVPGVIAYIMLIVAVPALVEERRGVLASMRRSRHLTKGSRWRIFALILLFLMVYFAVSAPLAGIASLDGEGSLMFTAVATSITTAATSLLASVMLAALYLELRVAKEGASGDALAAIFE